MRVPALLIILTTLLAIGSGNPASANGTGSILWYNKPATNWETESLPIGNGRLGGMVFGGVGTDHIQFNEDSLWIGDQNETGSYQAFGDIFIDLAKSGNVSVPTDYRRELDLDRAVETVSYTQDGIHFRREYFPSHSAGVLVIRLTADKAGSCTGLVRITDMHHGAISAMGNRLTVTGSLSGYKYNDKPRDYAISLNYEAQVVVLSDGGSVTAGVGAIRFADANSVTILLDAGTDYLNRPDLGWRQDPPHARITARLAAAAAKPYEALLRDHVADYRHLFGRVALDVGSTPASQRELPTNQRLDACKRGATDPELQALLFQFGRYLLISSSRDALPANLQGLWNNSNHPPWRCDYHSDINLEMNYWPADVTNLSECFQPLTDFLWSIRGVRKLETAKAFHVRGWTMHGENGAFGGGSWNWVLASTAWFCRNLWDHYQFTGDRAFLATRAQPMMREACQFWEDMLKTGPENKLVAPKNFSPEQMGYSEPGCSFDQELVWDLFGNYVHASTLLGVDADEARKVDGLRTRLLIPRVGKWGQLQEWMTDRDSPVDHHRHQSHLVGLYPGVQLTPGVNPTLAAAARKSLEGRGDGGTGWSLAWKISLWARLLDGNHAYKMVNALLCHGILPNLLDTCPPFQIDGNFGYTAGVAEMLLQSQQNSIDLLPALPSAWPSGSVSGLRARGAVTVDEVWDHGNLVSARLVADNSGKFQVQLNGRSTEVNLAAGIPFLLNGNLVQVTTKP